MMTLNSYIRLAVQPYIFQTLEENLYDYGSFYKILFISWLISGDASCFVACFRWFHVVPGRFSFY